MSDQSNDHPVVGPKLTSPWAPWPSFDEQQIEEVAGVLRSGKVNQWTGDRVWAFERQYAAALGRSHAVALMNGSVALELALKALGVGSGDEVVTTPRTFIASAGAIVLQGATPIFADVDRDSGNISAATIEPLINERTKAIIVVHLGGWPADMPEIVQLASDKGVAVIEDCAQAHGAMKSGRPVGAFGTIAAFSFCQDKIITTAGEGGLIALDDDEVWNKAWSFKDHGKSNDLVFNKQHPYGFRWLHTSFGSNWRMTELQAAIGSYQLSRLQESAAIRNSNAAIWREHLGRLDALRVPVVDPGDVHAYYKLYAYVRPESLKPGWSRDRLQMAIEEAEIPVASGSCSEIYREVAFTSLGLGPKTRLSVARELGETSLMFQVHPGLTPEALHEAGEIVARIVSEATR